MALTKTIQTTYLLFCRSAISTSYCIFHKYMYTMELMVVTMHSRKVAVMGSLLLIIQVDHDHTSHEELEWVAETAHEGKY